MNTSQLITRLDGLTQDFQGSFGSLSAEQLNWKPDATRWSIAQNLDHLIIINRSYFPVIKSVRQGTYRLPFIGKFGVVVRFFGKILLKAVQAGEGKKTKTFPIWEPSISQLPADMLGRFVRHQQELKEQISSAQDLLAKGIVISSPANRNIVYTLEAAFEILLAHEERHLLQAREVLRQLPKEDSLASNP